MTDKSDKQHVAMQVAALVEDGMTVGLGTGSTANFFIDELARLQQQGLSITTVSSSIVSAIKAKQCQLPLISIENINQVDMYVDGADEVTADKMLLKGRGFDLVKEKLLAQAAKQFYVLVDNSKLVSRIGDNYPIPVEVMPFAWQLVKNSIEKLGGQAQLRANSVGDGLAISSHGSLLLDAHFPQTMSATEINQQLNAIPGIVEHGIFEQLASRIFVGANGQVSEF